MINVAYKEVNDYLVRRISDPTRYRGMHLAQHQRLPFEKFAAILTAIFDVVGEEKFVEPSGDDPNPNGTHKIGDTRRAPVGMSLKDCSTYWEILDEIARVEIDGVGASFNSLKKNTFPNLERMEILQRIAPESAGGLKTAKLTRYAIEFIRGSNRQKVAIYSNAMQNIDPFIGSFGSSA